MVICFLLFLKVDGTSDEVFILTDEVGVYFVVAEEVGFGPELREASAGLGGVAVVAVPADGFDEVVVAKESFSVLPRVVVDEDGRCVIGVAEGLEGAGQVSPAVDEDDIE